jgi:hypothetical protein
MFRYIAILIVGSVTIANLCAGPVQIQIGGNTGLTNTYNVSGNDITQSGVPESAYAGTLFTGTGATAAGSNGSVLCAGATQGTCTAQASSAVPAGEPNNEFATSNGVTFSMINQPGTSDAVWATMPSGTNTITIPIGIFGVTNVYTMLNDEFGIVNANTTDVTFDFANPAEDETFDLVDGTVIRDDFDCTGGSGLSTCQSFNYATTLSSNAYSELGCVIGSGGCAAAGSPDVTAFNVWTGSYGQGAGHYINTTGNLFLDAQDFYLGSNGVNTVLTQIVITDTAGSTPQVSRDGLSAITVEASAPEPSTVFLAMTGIGVVGFIRRRRNQQ